MTYIFVGLGCLLLGLGFGRLVNMHAQSTDVEEHGWHEYEFRGKLYYVVSREVFEENLAPECKQVDE